jgi:hypothetical protein
MRLTGVIETQAAQLAGAPVTTTFNGYFGAWVSAAAANFRLRRLKLGVRGPAGSVTSDQHTIGIFRQTVRASGTGLANQVGNNLDMRGGADVTSGLDYTTATTAGTTGPTIAAVAMEKPTFNTQTSWDVPWDYIEDFVCDQGTANGLAFVNVGNALPSSHLFVPTITVEA